MKNINIFISSRLKIDENKINKFKSLTKNPISVEWYYNPDGKSLSLLYKEFLEKNKDKDEIVLLIHDDIDIITENWCEKLEEAFNQNSNLGILGIAGSSTFNQECMWWKCDNLHGSVYHRHNHYIWLSKYNSHDSTNEVNKVCVIDGLFMAIIPKRIKFNFDEEFEGFNMYDIDFCLANYLTNSCEIGVINNVQVIHNSIGELTENWFINREKLINKYKNKLHINE